MKVKKFLTAVFVTTLWLSLLFAAGCETDPQDQEAGTNDEEEIQPVESSTVEQRELEVTQQFSGEVRSEGEVILAAGIGGDVSEIYATTGEHVEEDQLLLTLKNDEIRAEVRQAEASLSQAQSNYISTREYGMPREEKELESALNQAEIEYESAREDYERMKNLYEQEAISQSELEDVRDRFEQAESSYENAREQLELFREGKEEELESLRAELSRAEAALSSARSALDETRIEAPFDGTISLIEAKEDMEVQAGMELLTITDFEQLYVELEITERNLAPMQEGDEVNIEVPAADFRGEGELQDIALSPRPGTKAYPAKAFFASEEPVRTGMEAEVSHASEKALDATAVPQKALLEEEGEYYSFVVENGTAHKRALELGLETGEYVEVKEGLEEGEQIVIQGHHYLEDGAEVEVVAGGEGS